MSALRPPKPNATVTIEPVGPRTKVPRDHSIKVVIKVSAVDPEHDDQARVVRVARKSLAGFPPVQDLPDGEGVVALSASSRHARARSVGGAVVAVEGSVVSPGLPGDDAVERCRATLLLEGYRVEVQVKRECADLACPTSVVIDWDDREVMPAGWHGNLVCARHNLRTCSACKSSYMMTSTNFSGHAPSLLCQVCGLLMVGWGGSKLWTAELLTKGRRPSGRPSAGRRS